MFNVETDTGIASARVNGTYIDAGVAGEIAGLEFSVDKMRMFDGPREQRHAQAIVTLDCTPQTLLMLATVILDKLDLPAFNSRQWRDIASVMRFGAHVGPSGDEMREMAAQIEASVENLNKLGIV
jgi:hypothetical protein